MTDNTFDHPAEVLADSRSATERLRRMLGWPITVGEAEALHVALDALDKVTERATAEQRAELLAKYPGFNPGYHGTPSHTHELPYRSGVGDHRTAEERERF